jgi:hypothetical protein
VIAGVTAAICFALWYRQMMHRTISHLLRRGDATPDGAATKVG